MSSREDHFTYTAFTLAVMADCQTPDSLESEGALMLLSVQAAVNDFLHSSGRTVVPYSISDLSDVAHEIADAAPDVYTYTRWREFVDLGAWLEDISELSGEDGDLTAAAGVALYIIAERLAIALLGEYVESLEDTEEDSSEEDD